MKSPRTGRRRAVIVGWGVTAGLSLLLGHQIVQRTAFNPESTVRAYTGDLVAKDAGAALSLVSIRTLGSLDRTMLVDGALAEPPQRLRVITTRREHHTVVVDVRQTLDGRETKSSYELVREGRRFGLWSTWKLRFPFSDLEITQHPARRGFPIRVNGIDAGEGSHPVFAGTYTVTSPEQGLVAAAQSRVVATGRGTAAGKLDATLVRQARKLAEQAVRRFLRSCAQTTLSDPPDCPLGYGGFDIKRASWSIPAYPIMDVTLQDSGKVWAWSRGLGSARIRGRSSNLVNGKTWVDGTIPISLTGTLTWGGSDRERATFTWSGIRGY